jgi:hypothetical protein
MIFHIHPELIWLGVESKGCKEIVDLMPIRSEFMALYEYLKTHGYNVILKTVPGEIKE